MENKFPNFKINSRPKINSELNMNLILTLLNLFSMFVIHSLELEHKLERPKCFVQLSIEQIALVIFRQII